MTKRYKHLFFDLDHTLWDFEKNSTETLTELFFEFELDQFLRAKLAQFLDAYDRVNRTMWQQYNAGSITKESMRQQRFSDVFRRFGKKDPTLALAINDVYLARCPTRPHLIQGTLETLNLVSSHFQCHIITNGFSETQDRKLHHSGIKHYFQHVFTSESTGFTKPDRRIFHAALSTTGATPQNSLMIGDNLATDILGARSMKMDQVYCNYKGHYHREKVTYEITKFEQLKHILTQETAP